MDILRTPRLVFVPTPLHVVRERLERAPFDAVLEINGRRETIHFPTEWPGAALALFPALLEKLTAPNADWDGTLIERSSNVAVGQLGFKSSPDEHGTIELGYGVNPTRQGRGYATEIVAELIRWAAQRPDIKQVNAETLPSNLGSIRVLEKNRFEQVGQREDDEGNLLLWQIAVG